MKINASVFLATTIVCYGLLSMKIKEVHAGAISSTLIPSETRRQGIAQENPCPGDTLMLTCTISSSAEAVRWSLDGTQLYTFVNPDDINSTESSNGLTGSLFNATTITLLVDLSATLDAEVTNGTVISCEEVAIGGTTTTETLTIIGVASAPTVSVRPGSLTSITIDMTVPEYGRECVDMYRATAVVGGVTQPPVEVTVTDPNQMMYSFSFSGLDLCRHMLTSATAVAVTNGVEGTMATPVTTDPLSDLLQVQLLDNGISCDRQLTSPIRWSQQLNSTTVPSDCVSHFVISWTGSATGSYSTSNASTFSVTPEQLVESGLPDCANVTLTILPFVSRFGAVTTSAAVANDPPAYVPMKGFEGPMVVSITPVNKSEDTGTFSFTFTFNVEWTQASTPSTIQAVEVGYSINENNCTPTMTVDSSSTSQVVSITNVEQLVGANVTACVQYRNGECTSKIVNSTPQRTSPQRTPVAAIVVPVILVVAAIVIIIVIIIVYVFCRPGRNKSGQNAPLSAHVGEGKHKAKSDKGADNTEMATYQDPNTIKQKEAETGDLYAVAERPKKKSSKKKEKSEVKKGQLTYADIDIGGGSRRPIKPVPEMEYATVVN